LNARVVLSVAAWLMAAAVAAGAFGAHALKARLAPDALALWHTAVDYHAWHALGLLGAGLLMLHWPNARAIRHAAWLFLAGIALFCGSLYALALGAPPAVGGVTPVGGGAFIAGWAMLAVSAASH